MENKVALVIEGGAMRGAFLKGVLDCFKENGIKFPYVVGVSAGAITGFEFFSGIKFDVNKLFQEFLKNMEMLKNSSEPIDLVSMVNSLYDFPEFDKNLEGEFEAGVTSLLDGSYKFFSSKDAKNTSDMVDKIIASSSLPDMAKCVMIDGFPYFDGGMYNTNPLERAIEKGYDKFVVLLAKNRGYRRENSEISDIVRYAYKDYPKFIESMENEKNKYNETMDLVDKLEREEKALVFAPVNPLKFKSFTTNMEDVIDLYKEGYMVASQSIEKVKKFV
ncbi:patatin family protein [Parvimonas sp. G1425]|uniref:patatin family protein n=1 Tax=Parvimonas sp. G1425 TaxID=3387694 RepID=UPI0039E6A079